MIKKNRVEWELIALGASLAFFVGAIIFLKAETFLSLWR